MKNIWCVIPVYNNRSTIRDIVKRSLAVLPNVLVADDGSTDENLVNSLADLPVTVIRSEHNQGKGAAIRTAMENLKDKNVDYFFTIDGDGQHDPEDMALFLPRIEEQEHTLFIGCRDLTGENVPASSRFGRSFANFWMKVETGVTVDDCQSGFRAYPFRDVIQLKCLTCHYNYETEILTRSAWAGLDIVSIPIRTHYPEREKRISHFHPWRDNFRISCIHTHLFMMRILPIPKKKLIRRGPQLSIFRPKELMLHLLRENATPRGLAASAAVGTFLAVLPIFGGHIIAILYVTQRFHLNKIMALTIQHLFMPPLSPFLCIELGYYFLHRKWLTTLSFETVVIQMPHRLFEWLLGSLVLAPFWAAVIWFATLGLASFFASWRKGGTNGGTKKSQ